MKVVPWGAGDCSRRATTPGFRSLFRNLGPLVGSNPESMIQNSPSVDSSARCVLWSADQVSVLGMGDPHLGLLAVEDRELFLGARQRRHGGAQWTSHK